jgi:hypothetical protein
MFTPRVHAGKGQTYRIKIEKTINTNLIILTEDLRPTSFGPNHIDNIGRNVTKLKH